MKNKIKAKSLLERKMEDPHYRKRFESGYPAFELEVQILNALEKKGWTLSKLAKVMHTSKSDISRDLSMGGIRSASIKRVSRMAEALGQKFVPVFISEKKEKKILPKIQELITA